MIVRRPSGLIEPCLPSKAVRPPSGPLWVHEKSAALAKLRSRHVAVATAAFAQSPNRQPADKNPPAAQTQPNNAAGSSATQQNPSQPAQGGRAANPPARPVAGSTTAPANPTITLQAPRERCEPIGGPDHTNDLLRPSRTIFGANRASSSESVWGVTTCSKFKARNFGGGLCVRWRQLDRGMPGGGSEVLWSPHVEPPILD